MSLEQVNTIFGVPGTLVSHREGYVIYQWKGNSDGVANVQFQNGVVTDKTEFKLE